MDTIPQKQCRDCLKYFPLTGEHWLKNKQRNDGWQSRCKSCHHSRKSYSPVKNRLELQGRECRLVAIACTKCGVVYPLDEKHFPKDCAKVIGFSSWCRKCFVKDSDKWAKENPEKRKKQTSIYKRKHREILRLRKLEYRHKNPESARKTRKQWEKANPERLRARDRRRRVRKMAAEGFHTVEETRQLYTEQQGLCFHCKADISAYYEEDHWIPLSRGGNDDISNIRLLCFNCNRTKSNKLPHEWHERYRKSDNYLQ